MNAFSRTLLFGAVFSMLPVTAFAGPVELVAHRVLYEVSLGSKRDSAINVENVSGRLLLEMRDSCEGWILEQDHIFQMHFQTGESYSESTHFSTWEAKNGSTYRFTVSRKINDESSDIIGAAFMGESGNIASYVHPETINYDLPEGTLFPLAHSKALLERAIKGEKQFSATVFEGHDGTDAKLLVAFISPLKKNELSNLDPLLKVQGWTFSLAYFDPKSPSPKPLYEVEADMLVNGIASRLLWDFGDFNVELKISEFEGIKSNGC